MTLRNKIQLIFGSLGLFLWPLILQAETLASLPLVPEQLQPQQLQYQARKLFITADTKVQLAKSATKEVKPQLASVTEGRTRQPDTDRTILTTIQTSVLGRHTQIHTWMNPDGGILQLNSLRTGSKLRFRQYRYLQDQVYSIKRFPVNDTEAGLPSEQWSRINEDKYPLQDGAAVLPLTEAEGLFYLLTVTDWNAVQAQHQLYLFDPDGIIELRLNLRGLKDIKVDYKLISADGTQQQVRGTVKAQQVQIDASPWHGKGKPGNFDFLGFKGNLNLYVDPQQRLILLMRGDVDVMGELDVRLQKVDYR